MLTKEQIKDTLVHNSTLLKEYKVSRIGLFGSMVNGHFSDTSDIDLLVDFSDTIDLFRYVHLTDTITSLLDRPVDLVTLNGIKPAIKDTILSEVEWVEGL